MPNASVACLRHVYRTFVRRSFISASVLLLLSTCLVWAAISLSTAIASVENFDEIGATAAATLPADFRVDKLTTARTVGSYSTALTATSLLGGANLSSTAGNGIYNFGSGTTTTGSDRAIGFVSSGSGTVSGNLYAQLANHTGSPITALQISYNVEKYRMGINPAGFCIQLYYSATGAAGSWTAAPAPFLTAFPQDTGGVNSGYAIAPGATVPVSGTLAVAIPDAGSFYLAWNYSVCSGSTSTNSQALAVDDISIQGVGTGPTNPTASGAATPATVQAGNSTTLTVNVTPGTNPDSTGVSVTGDLSSIGGSATQAFYDDGVNGGDSVAGDHIYTFQATIPAATTATAKLIPVAITDAQSRSANTSISLTVTPAITPPTGTGAANPGSLQAGGATVLTVTTTAGTNPASSVTGDLTAIGGSATQTFFDDGDIAAHGDATAGDGIFSYKATVANGTAPGAKSLPITIADAQSHSSSASITVTVQPSGSSATIKISQVYGGGGNSGATFTNDFIEIFNQGPTAVDLAAWSVQYSSATASTWQVTSFCPSSCMLQPGHYFLIQEGKGAGGTTPLPTPDFVPPIVNGTDTAIAMSGTNAKVALVASTTALTGACPTGGAIVDLVGYGSTANCFEIAPTPSLSNTTAAIRRRNGCQDTDNNSADFLTSGPIPRNTASPVQTCSTDAATLSGSGTATPSAVDPASNSLLSVAVSPATSPASTGISVVADLSNIGGSSTQQFYDDATHGDATSGDNIFSFEATVGAAISTGVKSSVATITDLQGRTASAPISLSVASPTCGVERWAVKVGVDADALLTDMTHATRAQIADLGTLQAPLLNENAPYDPRFVGVETTLYVVNGTMTAYKKETDVDYHIVLSDGATPAHTVIVEIPSPACIITSAAPRVFAPSPFAAGIAVAREKFDAKFTATTSFTNVSVPVQIKGIGFFDFIHGQNGVALNGIELHPVVDISFTSPTTTTLVSTPNPSQYAQPFTVTATVAITGGGPVPTGNVTLYDGPTYVSTAQLDPAGVATFNTSSLSVGPHSLTASYEGDSAAAESKSAALAHTVNKADQTITFDALADKTYGDADFSVNATSSSGLAVGFSVASGPATMLGNTVHITGAGLVSIRASQPGDTNYNAADSVDESFTVHPAAQTINFASLSGKTYGDAPFSVTATGGASTSPVTFSASGNCTSGGVNGSTITITGAGSCTVTASQAADPNYLAAADVSRTFAIAKATPAFSDLSSPSIILGATPTSISGKIAFAALVPTGTVAITLNGVTQSAAVQSDGSFSSSFSTGTLAPSDPAYAISFSYSGDGNFNVISGSSSFTVAYGVAPLFDQSRPAQGGSAVPARLALSNAAGANTSSASVVVTAVQLVQVPSGVSYPVQDSGNANPGGRFRFDGSAYIFNLNTKDLPAGTYNLLFTVSGDPTTHTISFLLR